MNRLLIPIVLRPGLPQPTRPCPTKGCGEPITKGERRCVNCDEAALWALSKRWAEEKRRQRDLSAPGRVSA